MEFTAIRASTAAAREHDVDKEHMFDKVVTPSDVGKLNRLVIPKQHAQNYFPLDAYSTNQSRLLSFEDNADKRWRFRYSYWNNSHSYVITKGWSHFVKDKHLHAGDTVSFGRGVGESARDRLFIDWCRRPDSVPAPPAHHHRHFTLPSVPFAPWTTHYPIVGGGNMIMSAPSPVSVCNYETHHYLHKWRHIGHEEHGMLASRQVLFYRSQQQYNLQSVVQETVPVRIVAAPGHLEPSGSKRVRLFGVTLVCAAEDEEDFGGQ